MRKNTITGCLANLQAVLSRVDHIDRMAGMTAYSRYQQTMCKLASHYGYTLEQVTAVFVALSPNNDYDKNLRSAITLLSGHRDGIPVEFLTVSTYNACKMRAWGFLNGIDFLEFTKGHKTRAFYKCILDPNEPDAVVVDGHMVSAWHGKPMTMLKVAQYGFDYDLIADDVRTAAKGAGILPCQAQSMIWFTWKRIHNIVYDCNLYLFGDHWKLDRRPEDIRPYPYKARGSEDGTMSTKENKWIPCTQLLPGDAGHLGADCQIKMRDGSILQNAIHQVDGDWYWNGIFIDGGQVESWKLVTLADRAERV